VSDRGFCRPTDLAVSRGNPSKARERLGWVAKHQISEYCRVDDRGSAGSVDLLDYLLAV
jgi:GDP-D-mannose dehydratase